MDLNSDLDDKAKLELILALVKSMAPEFKELVVQQLADANSIAGEAQITVASNETTVKVQFNKPLSWFIIPKANALQLGISLMQHSGATLQQLDRPEQPHD